MMPYTNLCNIIILKYNYIEYTGCPKKNGVQLLRLIAERKLDHIERLFFSFMACSFAFRTRYSLST